jgi:histone H3/H4
VLVHTCCCSVQHTAASRASTHSNMADEYSRSVARVIAAQIAEASGFDACQESAIEVLADLLLRYLTTVCSSSHSYAELAGRSQSNLADVLLSLEELEVTADDLHQHLELQVCWCLHMMPARQCTSCKRLRDASRQSACAACSAAVVEVMHASSPEVQLHWQHICLAGCVSSAPPCPSGPSSCSSQQPRSCTTAVQRHINPLEAA